jgi:hypothetical protein
MAKADDCRIFKEWKVTFEGCQRSHALAHSSRKWYHGKQSQKEASQSISPRRAAEY